MPGRSAEEMRAIAPKPGEVRNPKGINGWTKLRERAAADITASYPELMDKLIELAREGDTQALKLALGPILDLKTHLLGQAEDAPPIQWRFAKPGEVEDDERES